MLEAQRRSTASRRRGTRLRTFASAALAASVAITAFAAPVDAHKKGKNDKQDEEAATVEFEISDGSMYAVVDQIGARGLWEQGYTGEGVNVAVIDTGVAPVDALADQVIATVDLSSDAGDPALRYVDSYGHGTHMAGIIAGKTPGADPALAEQHPEWFVGVAPDAGIVSVKVGAYDGAVDITQVIAGVDWVVDHADELDIDVINLSYSSGSELKYQKDPLAYAVERAWNAGIVVVVAAGNDGEDAERLASPAYDPFVIAVAGAELESSAKKKPKFGFARWNSYSDGKRDPDIIAPGASIESLRVPGSYIDQEFPEGYVDEQIFKGSGSSQAAAVVSGAAALILDARPDLTPDEVKVLLMAEGAKVAKSKHHGDAELVDLEKIVDAKLKKIKKSKWKPSTGSGSLDKARGSAPLLLDGEPLIGDVTALGTPWVGGDWEGVRWSAGEWDGVRWSAGEWMGVRWSNATWTGEAWMGVRWSDEVWSGVRWSDSVWDGVRWSGVRWSDAHWDGVRWSGVRWSDESWTGVRWSGVRWSDAAWEGVRWSDATWSSAGWG